MLASSSHIILEVVPGVKQWILGTESRQKMREMLGNGVDMASNKVTWWENKIGKAFKMYLFSLSWPHDSSRTEKQHCLSSAIGSVDNTKAPQVPDKG